MPMYSETETQTKTTMLPVIKVQLLLTFPFPVAGTESLKSVTISENSVKFKH
jgi:hypothetical protein